MKTISILIYFLCMNTVMYAQYIASIVEQVSSSVIAAGSVNNPIIRIKIDVGPTPIDLYALFLNTVGSTNPSTDIDSTKIFYTDSSNIFSITTQYLGGTFPLNSGTNYFWFAYDISSAAIICDTLDATCNTVYVTDGTQTPSVTDPLGFGVIGNCATGINSNDLFSYTTKIYPNPSTGKFTIEVKRDNVQGTILEIYNVLEEKIYSAQINSDKTEIDLTKQPKGIHFYQLQSDWKILGTGKIMIE